MRNKVLQGHMEAQAMRVTGQMPLIRHGFVLAVVALRMN